MSAHISAESGTSRMKERKRKNMWAVGNYICNYIEMNKMEKSGMSKSGGPTILNHVESDVELNILLINKIKKANIIK